MKASPPQPSNSATPPSALSGFSFQPSAFSSSSPQPFSGVFAGKKVWLTGVSGFKGSWLAEWLLSLGAKVHGFSLPPPTAPSLFEQAGLASRIQWDCDDVRDAAAVKKSLLAAQPDFVFHLAAQPLVRLSYREPVETWETNVMGTINVLEALRALKRGNAETLSAGIPPSPQPLTSSIPPSDLSAFSLQPSGFSSSSPQPSPRPLVAVMITTDKCYENREWQQGYREEDPLGGYDPYSSSKAACEIAIASWRRSFFSPQPLPSSTPPQPHPVFLASARAGNVIGGGDWAQDRIVPDCIRALKAGEAIPVRNKTSTRPWQHVLEPLSGYLTLAARMAASVRGGEEEALKNGSPAQPLNPSFPQLAEISSAFNFGPALDSNRTVADIVQEILRHWPGEWEDKSDPKAPHEAGKLNLATDKAFHLLGWQPRWDFETTIKKTVSWYREVQEGTDPGELTRRQIRQYEQGT